MQFEHAVAIDEGMADAWLGLHALSHRPDEALAQMARYEHRFGEERRHSRTALDYLNDVLEPTLQALEARLAGLVAQRAIVECDTRHAALMLLSPLLLALLHQRDLGGTRCRPLSIPALIDEHVKVFVRAYRQPG